MISYSRARNQRAVRWLCLPCFLVAWASMNAARPALAEFPTATDFSRLSEQEQLTYLKETLLEFRRHTDNFSATIIHTAMNLDYDPATDQVGRTVLLRDSTLEYDLRRIGDSYRVSRRRETHGRKAPGEITDITDIEGYDADAGRRKQYGSAPQDDAPALLHGLISPERSMKIAAGCHFFQYLGNRHPYGAIGRNDAGSHFLSSVDGARVTQVGVDDGLVEVVCPCKMPSGTVATCRVAFDLKKDALLIRRRLAEELEQAHGRLKERWDNVEVVEASLVGEVWIPTKMRITAWSSERPQQVTVHTITIKDVQLGKLTKADLEVDFPPGTEVRNEFTGERFKVGADGESVASTIQTVSTLTNVGSGTAESTNLSWGLIVLNALIIPGLIAFVIARRRRAA